MTAPDDYREVTPEELVELTAGLSRDWHQLPATLTPAQRFRLVEIAHETSDPAVKAAALGVLGEPT